MFHIDNIEGLNIAYSFRHHRDTDFHIKNKLVTDVTVCDILVNGKEFSGLAACSAEDKFIKEQGRKVSLARAMKAAAIPKSVRTVVWEKYHQRFIKYDERVSAELSKSEPAHTLFTTNVEISRDHFDACGGGT